MESSVLPSGEIRAILSSKFVCVKVDVDNPGPAEKMLSQVKGNVLPFYAYATSDGKFITGTSGFRNQAAFKADLEGVLKSDLLRVPPEFEKKLAKMADQAAKDLEARKIPAVVKAAREASAVRGTSESKDRIQEALARAVSAGGDRIKEAAELCRDAKFEEAGAILSGVTKDFKGSELEKPAAAATKALEKFKSAAKDAKGARRYYEQVVKDCKDAPPFVELAEAKLQE